MTDKKPRKTVVHVVGCAPSGGGYPNASNTIRMLESSKYFSVINHCFWLPGSVKLWKAVGGSRLRTVLLLARLVVMSFISVMRFLPSWLMSRGCDSRVYLPYPSIFSLLIFSLIPTFLRPSLICDFYISIFDSTFRDRCLNSSSRVARMVFLLERHALKCADYIFVDTKATKNEMVSLFSLDPVRVFSLPLAINESVFHANENPHILNRTTIDPVVLFVGNLSPLHGIGNILEAIEIALKERRFRFSIIGDGQDGPVVESFLSNCPRLPIYWCREWQDEMQLSRSIADADICLGVFGANDKATRVFPFKNYLYLCAGRPVISQKEYSLPEGLEVPPVVACGREPSEIASEIISLLEDSHRRKRIALESSRYFHAWLTQGFLERRWVEILRTGG